MIITLSRQYLAGASEVAERIAEQLDWTVVDDAFTDAIAERSGYTAEDVRSLEESVPSFMERFAQSSALSFPEFLLSTPSAIEEPEAVKLAHISREFIEELGHRNKVVMVGRAAAAVLARDTQAIHVRLVSSFESRVRNAVGRFGLSVSDAEAKVDEIDLNRERYHKEIFGRDWNDPVNYHMVLNTEQLGTDGTADLVVSRVKSLGWSSAV
jgi:cytidylate kinase